MKRRVFVLGGGAAYLANPYGFGSFADLYQKFYEPGTAIRALLEPISLQLRKHPITISHAAWIDNVEIDTKFPKHLLRHAAPENPALKSVKMALMVADCAVTDAGLPRDRFKICNIDPYRIGTYGGTGIGDSAGYNYHYQNFQASNWDQIGLHAVPGVMPNGPTTTVSILLGAKGQSLTVSTACASSADVCGLASRMIQSGELDIAIVVGFESVDDYFRVLFGLAGALSQRGDSKPFGSRDGFNLGEGAGSTVLASEKVVTRLGLHNSITAEILSYEACCDASSMVAPDEKTGCHLIETVFARALRDYGYVPIGNIVVIAHGTATVAGDENEAKVLNASLPGSIENIYVVSSKNWVGHMLGAAGLFGFLFGVQALRTQSLPTMGDYQIAEDCRQPRLTYCVGSKSFYDLDAEVALINAFGFGGQSSTMLIRRYKN